MTVLENYPFVNELITDSSGQVNKVIINLADYQKLIELLEDEGMYRAILEVKDEIPRSLSEALQELEKDGIFMANNEIVLKKIPRSSAWLALSARIEAEEEQEDFIDDLVHEDR